MAEFGGLGGLLEGLDFDMDFQGDLFALAVKRSLGDWLISSHMNRVEMWSALANVEWEHENGDTASYSFRAAGDLIAAICADGSNYMTYYCSGPYAVVSVHIANELKKEGWNYKIVRDVYV
jgi:hypothetical protein